ncbi:Sjogren's syndrome/scleroderma autoantigen 1 family protein [Natronolimnohabitans sp. A-GB9]|uniref:Sjogren's syndrome/scleroderma autoantigen 1 family protein n=1 Tax=Natronolimnohabitans sp. A-GB9 TaxID=3069757 RepID=UPI0027AE7597|nr:Sjogren's syndrome/scleroderma autoantigen 1 family protein [Natronolimnohabitans sp. A-GB9]MDQ2050329.1 Sjogren's syndrome/scleroderma autoantigen 1 family protein [Natronolimnohabitans sp. A-GB9]
MSDFDKEAEREKLREKYERDKQERQATQRMSDLLLKGATMTNAHCGTCGDPLFQMDGTTFCPSCHGNPDAVEGTDLEAQPADETTEEPTSDREPAATSESTADTEPEPATDDRPARTDRQQDQSTDTGSDPDSRTTADAPAPDASPTSAASDRQPSAARSHASDADRESVDRSTDGDRRSSGRTPATEASRPADGDLETAHASLVAALEKFAGKAAATDDPRYARECLEAAREAGETLETLR